MLALYTRYSSLLLGQTLTRLHMRCHPVYNHPPSAQHSVYYTETCRARKAAYRVPQACIRGVLVTRKLVTVAVATKQHTMLAWLVRASISQDIPQNSQCTGCIPRGMIQKHESGILNVPGAPCRSVHVRCTRRRHSQRTTHAHCCTSVTQASCGLLAGAIAKLG